MFLNRLTISIRLLLIVTGSIIGIIAVGGYSLFEIRTNLLEDRKTKTEHVVAVVEGLLTHYHTRETSGEMTREEAQRAAISVVEELRYSDNDYFWIQTYDNVMVMHPFQPQLNDTNLNGWADPNGIKLFDEMVKVVKKDGAGFVEYAWPKPGFEQPLPKVSFVKGFADWQWIVGSGIYIDDVDTIFQQVLLVVGAVALLILVIIVGASTIISRSVTHPIKVLGGKAEALSKGDLGVSIDLEGGDEIANLARSFDIMREAMRELVEGLETKVAERTEDFQSSEKRVQSIIDNAADGIIVMSENGIIQSFSPAAERIFGYTADETIEKNINMLMPEPMHSEHEDYLERFKQSGKNLNVGNNREVIGLRKNGITFPMDLAVGMAELGGEYIFTGIVRDITERKQAEEELQTAEEHTRLILESAGEGLFGLNNEGIMTFVNPSACRMLGFSSEEMIGQPLHQLIHHSYPDGTPYPQEKCHMRAAFTEGKVHNITDEVLWRKDGTSFQVEYTSTPIEKNAELLGAVVTFSDVTERKRAEAEIKVAMEKAEEATKAKAAFLASMSHEIRTPMNGIVGMADLLSKTDLNEDQNLMLNTIKDSGNSLLTVINDILDFSKIEADKLDFENVALSICDVLEGAAATISPNASRKNIQVVTYVDPDIPQNLLGDPVRLRQIIFNLTGNAVKFSEEGEVIVRADKVSADGDGAVVKISVVDNGIGISEDAQSKLFEAFSQADTSTTRRFGGTGLGLTICKSLTDKMGGEITVESQIGSGSTFSVELPLALGEEKETKSEDIDLDGVRLLIITESEMLGFAVKRYLEHWKAKVQIASSDAEIEEKILALQNDNKVFDVIALDYILSEDRQLFIVEKYKSDNTRFLIMSDGQRRSARVQVPDIITLDGNPLRQSQLINAVAVAVGRASPIFKSDAEGESSKAYIALSVEEALAQGTLILLAEDNITNQNVIQRQLNMLGYTCEIADDGKLALEAWRERDYGLLLSDCHMPHMDGFELTAAIRNDEEGSSKRAPIIAVTANALEGEAQRCIAEGMDDYLSKPLKMDDLKAMLKKWMPTFDPIEVVEMEEKAVEPKISKDVASRDDGKGEKVAIDPSALKSVFGDDEETFKEILKDFLEPAMSNIVEIEASFGDRSADGVAKAAHKLKSSARSVGANELADLCEALESAGKAEDWDEIDNATPRLGGVMDQVAEYINAL